MDASNTQQCCMALGVLQIVWALSALSLACGLPHLQSRHASFHRPAKFLLMPAPVSSHFAIAQPVIEELLERGHAVQVRPVTSAVFPGLITLEQLLSSNAVTLSVEQTSYL